jgi:alcohol dehydrogenase class IV
MIGMQSEAFVQRSPALKLIVREGVLAALPAELKLLGVQRPLVLSSRSTRQSAQYAELLQTLGGLSVLEGEPVPAHSSVSLVERLVLQAQQASIDGLIALGGGSVSDTAKAVALLLAEGGQLADHASRFTPPSTLHIPVLRQAKLPVVAIPTTASGAEVTPSLGVRDDTGRKLLFSDVQLASRLVLIDPLANVQVPAALMLSTGMNGLAHCIEGLYSMERAPLARTLALDAIPRFFSALPAVQREPHNPEHRLALMYAAHLSGLVLVHARTCLHHAICHAIGSVCGVGHGDANSVMLPHVLTFHAEQTADALALAARTIHVGNTSADFIAALQHLQQSIQSPARLRDIGVAHVDLDRIATKTMGERGLYFNPRAVRDVAEIRALLEAAY